MNIDFENIPRLVFEWVENIPFEKLSEHQKKTVLESFSQQDYEEMYNAFQSVREFSAPMESEGSMRKTLLLNHFDRHQENRKAELRSSRRLVVWQAAAVLLLMLAGWLFYQLFDFQKGERTQEVASTDTVYVTKEVSSQPEVVHDTVFRYELQKAGSASEENQTEAVVFDEEQGSPMEDTNLVPVMELENLNPTSRGSSMRDDSLLRKFEFVAM